MLTGVKKISLRAYTVSCLLGLMTLAQGDVSGEELEKPGEAIYEKTMERAQKALDSGKEALEVSEIYLWGAGQCRDLVGGSAYALKLFKHAVNEDPSNARAHLLYGDYFMGYRGLYRHARYHYYRALELVQKDPFSYEDDFKQKLERSFEILNRDGKDGVPVITSSPLSIFVNASHKYGGSTRNRATVSAADGSLIDSQRGVDLFLSGRAQELREGIEFFSGVIAQQNEGVDFFQDQVDESLLFDDFLDCAVHNPNLGLPFPAQTDTCQETHPNAGSIPTADTLFIDDDGDVTSINTKQDENAEARSDLEDRVDEIEADKADTEKRVKRSKRELHALPIVRKKTLKRILKTRKDNTQYDVDVMIRFGPTYLPYIQLTFESSEEDGGVSFFPETFGTPLVIDFERTAVTLGRNMQLAPQLSLKVEAVAADSTLQFRDTANNLNLAQEDARRYSLEGTFSYSLPFQSLQLKVGGRVSESIENFDSNHDGDSVQLVSLRWSRFPDPSKSIIPEVTQANERFRGRRSSHTQIGLTRSDRVFRSDLDNPSTVEKVWRPLISFEELGFMRGKLDLLLLYDWRYQELRNDGEAFEADSDAHFVKFMPTWVSIYKLYDHDFWTGIEHLTVGFPITTSIGDGPLDRWTTGAEIYARFVTALGLSIEPTVNVFYANYPDLHVEDWGFLLKCKITSGAKRRLKEPVWEDGDI